MTLPSNVSRRAAPLAVLVLAAAVGASAAKGGETVRVETASRCDGARALDAIATEDLGTAAEAADASGDRECASELWRVLSRRRLAAADYDAGLESAERALLAARRSADPVLEADALLAHGNANFYRLDYDAARSDFEAALSRLGDAEEPRLRVAILQDLGITHANDGRPDLGLMFLHRAVEDAERLLPDGAGPSLWSNLGTVYERLDAPPLALETYERARALAEGSGSEPDLHDSLTRLGALRLDAGRLPEARADLEAALALAERFAGTLERTWTLPFLVHARAADGDRDGAIDAAREAAVLSRRLGHASGERVARAKLALLQMDDDPAAARRELDEGLHGTGAGDAMVWELEGVVALWERRWGSQERALEVCDDALARLEAWRDGLSSLEARRGLHLRNRPLYERCLDAALAAGDDGVAFDVLERARAPAWRAAPALPSELRRSELVRRLEDLSARRDALAAGQVVDRKPLEPIELEIDQIRRALSGAGPRRAISRVTSAALADRLPADAALVVYGFASDRLYAFVVSGAGLYRAPIEVPRADLALRIENFAELVASDRRAGWIAAGEALHRDLFSPLRSLLPKSVRRLVIVADGELAPLPFDALVTEPPSQRSARPRFLVEELAIVYAPSAADWAAGAEASREPIRAAATLVVGDPSDLAAEVGSLAALVRATYEEEGLARSPLPFARREAELLAERRAGPTVSLAGELAREDEVKSRLREGARIAHFATHGFASSWSDHRSALVLAPAPGEDGFLQARELSALALDLDLVVLAACRSAAGRVRAGDHVRSLAHSFLEAGARTVVAALWEVPDGTTFELMSGFYDELAAGRPRAEALRRAKLERLERGAPPRAWAGLVLLGDGDAPLVEGWRPPGRLPPTARVAALAALAGFLLAAVFLARRRGGPPQGASQR